MTNRKHRLLIGTALTVLAAPAAAQTAGEAQAQIANQSQEPTEIIVTATKRASTVQDVPFSINAQTQQQIERSNANTVEDLSRNVAGLTVQNLGPGQSQVSVRGVSAGQIVRDQPGVKEQVGVYLDESVVSLSLFTPDFDLFDLNRVETLRGPQGTLFGSGSVGGTIRYITNQPRLGRTDGQVEAGINTVAHGGVGYDLKGAINVPLGPTAAARVVAYGTKYPGFIDAIGPAAGKNVNDGSRVGTRVSLLWQPAPGIKLTPRLVYQKVKANGFNREERYSLYANQFLPSQPQLGEYQQYLKLREAFRDKTLLADLTASAEVGSNVELTSVTSYIKRDILVSRDASALTGSVYVSFAGAAAAAAGGANLPSNLRDTTNLKQFTQELRLGSTGAGPFQWVLGGFYSHVDRKYQQLLPTPGSDVFSQIFLNVAAPGVTVAQTRNGFAPDSPYNSSIPYVIKQKALFGEASYKLGQFKVTAGGRLYDFKETRDFISGGVFANGDRNIGDKTKSNGFSPRGIVTWQPDRSLSVNVQAAKGFRLGGVNDPLNIPLCSGGATGVDAQTFGNRPTYRDESLWNYEANFKYSKRGITFNAAAFYNDIKNLQVTADAGSCSSRVVFNVPKAHAKGVEAELNARVGEGFDLSFAGSLTDAKFDSSVTTTSGVVIAGIRDGNRLPTVPRYQLAATGTYTVPLGAEREWFTTASVQRIGSRFTQPGDQEPGAALIPNALYYNPATGAYGSGVNNFGSFKLPAYTLVNVSTGVNLGRGVEIQLFANNLFDKKPLLSLDRERGARARIGYNVGQPRTIGVTARFKFGR